MKLEIPEGEFAAYLFDCDGTIVDSMPLHYRAWKKALSEWKCDFSEELFYQWGGMPVAEVIARLNRERGHGVGEGAPALGADWAGKPFIPRLWKLCSERPAGKQAMSLNGLFTRKLPGCRVRPVIHGFRRNSTK